VESREGRNGAVRLSVLVSLRTHPPPPNKRINLTHVRYTRPDAHVRRLCATRSTKNRLTCERSKATRDVSPGHPARLSGCTSRASGLHRRVTEPAPAACSVSSFSVFPPSAPGHVLDPVGRPGTSLHRFVPLCPDQPSGCRRTVTPARASRPFPPAAFFTPGRGRVWTVRVGAHRECEFDGVSPHAPTCTISSRPYPSGEGGSGVPMNRAVS